MLNSSAKIKKSLIDKRTTAAAIARNVGVHRSYITHVIAGRSKAPHMRQIIADALSQKIEDLWPDAIEEYQAAQIREGEKSLVVSRPTFANVTPLKFSNVKKKPKNRE
jgi:lambda repressor-like predicted transcriptional regulator